MAVKEPTQLTLPIPNMPEPVFDAKGFSQVDIEKAQRKVDETLQLIDAHPDLMKEATRLATSEASERGHVGTRWLGESIRHWLDGDGKLNNDSVAVIARLIRSQNPWLGGFMELRCCALDAVMEVNL